MNELPYVLAYTINVDGKYVDRYEVHEDYESAELEYKGLLEQDNLYTASISKAITGTDI